MAFVVKPAHLAGICARWVAAGFFAVMMLCAELPAEPTNEDCLTCHDDVAVSGDAAQEHAAAAHSDLDCVGCHTDAEDLPHEDDLADVSLEVCGFCHADEVDQYSQGSHAKARANGLPVSATCASCHGDIHRVVSHAGDGSPEHLMNLAEACASCHADAELAAALNLTVVRPSEAYLESAHARAVRAGRRGAVCSDCHDPHRTLPANDPDSSIWAESVPQTCGECHREIRDKFMGSVHGGALANGMRDAPTCTDCHGEHRILSHLDRDSPVFSTNIPRETCGRCHSDTRLIERHGLEKANWSAFQDSFHGLALRAGQVEAANCASCHGVHDVLPSTDPRSSVHPDNLAATCARCHPGAGERFAVGPVHVSAALEETGLEYWIRIVYLWLIAVVIGGMFLHNAADLFRKANAPAVSHGDTSSGTLRMPRVLRWQHRLVMISFPLLAYSGFALTSPESWWAAPLLHWETTYATRGVVHRIAAIVMSVAVVWHVGGVFLSVRQRRYMQGIGWAWADVRHFFAMAAYYLGVRRDRPLNGKFSYIEKAEYWAFMWGSVLMALTGLPLWFENTTLRYFPKWVADVATTIHFYEAVLATLAILVWHLYWVIFDPDVYPMDRSWWTGYSPPAREAERRAAQITSENEGDPDGDSDRSDQGGSA